MKEVLANAVVVIVLPYTNVSSQQVTPTVGCQLHLNKKRKKEGAKATKVTTPEAPLQAITVTTGAGSHSGKPRNFPEILIFHIPSLQEALF